jgi:molybdopterin-biosynthesis enzyme MoeA-like protein
MSGCQKAYYETMEMFGKHKRDILVDNVADARDAQDQAKEQFASALEEFISVTGSVDGKLEEKYKTLNAAYEKSRDKAHAVKEHIKDVRRVAEALFNEWEDELDEYTNSSLRQKSEDKFKQTKQRYAKLISAMERAESKIAPVLSAFHDQVLFLKHNLNAQAIASLQDELTTVENEIGILIEEMEKSIDEANAFIQEMTRQGS